MGSNCCRRHVKGKEATSNTKIVANMPTAAAAAAAAATASAAAVESAADAATTAAGATAAPGSSPRSTITPVLSRILTSLSCGLQAQQILTASGRK